MNSLLFPYPGEAFPLLRQIGDTIDASSERVFSLTGATLDHLILLNVCITWILPWELTNETQNLVSAVMALARVRGQREGRD